MSERDKPTTPQCSDGNLTFPCSIRNGGNGENHPVQVYPEQLLGKIAKKAFATLGCSADEFFEVRQLNMLIINIFFL